MGTYVLAAFALVLVAINANGQTAHSTESHKSNITVTVRDPSGAAISNAFVLVHSDALGRGNSKPFQLELRTDSSGVAKNAFPSGFYDLFVAATGFAPSCEKIRVHEGEGVERTFVLKVDQLMTNEYGDTFGP
jgi:hypothetical protein